MKYKFKEGEDKSEKPIEERLIVKEGFVAEFSLVGVKKDFANFDKTIKELKANSELKKGVMANIEAHHPFVKDIPEFDRYTIHMYQEAAAGKKAFDAKVAEVEKEYEAYKAELEEIQAQIPELAPVVSPYMAQPEAAAEAPKSTELNVGAEPADPIKRYCREKGCENEITGKERYCEPHSLKGVDNSKKEDEQDNKKTE